MIILRPAYGDMSVVILGASVKTIIKKLKDHWEDELEDPEDYYPESIHAIKTVLNTEYSTIDELIDKYNELIDEDYSMQEA